MTARPSVRAVPAIPTAEAASLRRLARRAQLQRLALGVALLALLVAAVLLARRPTTAQGGLLSRRAGGVVVIDVSRSIDDADALKISSTLNQLAGAGAPVGLILFSDIAYELLPPGSPARELRPFARFFERANGVYLANPWASTFRAGTRISAGLNLARQVLQEEGAGRGSVLLLSDLQTASSDQAELTQSLVAYRHDGITLKVVPLFPLPDNQDFFKNLVGSSTFVEPAGSAVTGPSGRSPGAVVKVTSGAPLPLALLAVGAALLLALAAHERWCTRLAVRFRATGEGEAS